MDMVLLQITAGALALLGALPAAAPAQTGPAEERLVQALVYLKDLGSECRQF